MASTPDYSQQELARIVAAAQDLLLERGIGPVTLADVALALRLPVAELDRYFPQGKPALAAAVVGRYQQQFTQRLATHGPQSANAVEEMLRVRQTLQALPDEMRSLFMHELQRDYPALHQQLRQARLASVLAYMRLNLQRGLAEGLYQPQLDVEQEAQQWFAQADAAVHAATSSQELSELLTNQVTRFLDRVTTPAGAFVTRRLQETAPYY